MDDTAKKRAGELFAVLMARTPNPHEIDDLLAGCDTLEAFRVALVTDPRYADRFVHVIARWRDSVPEQPNAQRSLTGLGHAIEALKERHRILADVVDEGERQLMDLMKQVDLITRVQIERSEEVRSLKAVIISVSRHALQLERMLRQSHSATDA
jgi:hypothetical protein